MEDETKICCPTCKGSKVANAEVTIHENGKETLQKFKMPCTRCKETGEIYAQQLIWEQQEDEIWCKCEGDHDANFHDDGNNKEYPYGFTCNKHHYSCSNCNLIVQIG